MLTKIRNEREFKAVLKTIESLSNKSTEAGGFHRCCVFANPHAVKNYGTLKIQRFFMPVLNFPHELSYAG